MDIINHPNKGGDKRVLGSPTVIASNQVGAEPVTAASFRPDLDGSPFPPEMDTLAGSLRVGVPLAWFWLDGGAALALSPLRLWRYCTNRADGLSLCGS